MPGLLGYLASGAAQGIGQGMVQAAQTGEQMNTKMLDLQMQDLLDQKAASYKADQAAADQANKKDIVKLQGDIADRNNKNKAQYDAAAKAAADKTTYKTQESAVESALGTPAVDTQGNPITDPISGRQVVNRNPQREKQFYQWMQKNGITDTNEALQKFVAQNPSPAPATPPQNIDWSKYQTK